MIFIDRLSPNFSDRRDGKKPYILLLHYTDTMDVEQALQLLHNVDHQASAHYVVDTNGDIYRVIDEDKRAWHAGQSYWAGETDINSCSIGIEIQNPGHQFGYVPFHDVQMDAVEELCEDIMARHKILPHNVLGHSDVAPARKKDPGELFPWEGLARNGVGIWPQEIGTSPAKGEIYDLLVAYGYDPSLDEKTLITAFQRHFEPEAFQDPVFAGTATDETLRRIKSLLKQTGKG